MSNSASQAFEQQVCHFILVTFQFNIFKVTNVIIIAKSLTGFKFGEAKGQFRRVKNNEF